MTAMNPLRSSLSVLLLASAAFAQTYYWNPSPAGGGEAQKTQNWTSRANGGGFNPPSLFDDGFDDTLMGPWTYVDSVRDGFSEAGFARNPGQLTILSRGVDLWNNDNEFAAVYRTDIQGNFDVSVKVALPDRRFRMVQGRHPGGQRFTEFRPRRPVLGGDHSRPRHRDALRFLVAPGIHGHPAAPPLS